MQRSSSITARTGSTAHSAPRAASVAVPSAWAPLLLMVLASFAGRPTAAEEPIGIHEPGDRCPARGLVRYLLFADEVPLPSGGIEGDARYKSDFAPSAACPETETRSATSTSGHVSSLTAART